jgi:hypothetical protein
MAKSYDPNTVFENGVVDQSDLTTFVNLSVSIPKRIIDIMPEGDVTKLTYTHINNNNDSIIEGTRIGNNGYMTTSYVDITFTNDENGLKNKELFGITDINIDFDTSYHPLVTINFTDIKGAALFNPSELLSLINKGDIMLYPKILVSMAFNILYFH